MSTVRRFVTAELLSRSEGLSETVVGKIVQECSNLMAYLQLPSRSEYWMALQDATRDVSKAILSMNTLTFLTFRPVILLLWWISQQLYKVGKFLFRHLFQGLYHSTIKGWHQAKWLARKLVKLQFSLSPNQVKIELGIILMLILLYALRRHIQKQGYVQRVTKWYHVKQRRAIKFYRLQLDRLSKTSILLAMILPHALFAGVCFSMKLLFPSVVTYLARETYLIFCISVIYPWIWTVALVFQYNHPDAVVAVNKVKSDSEPDSITMKRIPASEGKRTPFSAQSTTSSQPSTIYPRTNPKQQTRVTITEPHSRVTPKTPVQRLVEASHRRNTNYSTGEEAKYWLDYWIIYGVFNGTCRAISLIPIVGRILSHSYITTLSMDLQLFFYLWLFGLESALLSTASSDADFERSYLVRPMPFLLNRITPLLQRLYKGISHDILTPSLWMALVDKVKSVLSLAVLVRLVSEPTSKRLLLGLEIAHDLVVPSVSLLLPGFLTQWGVLYVKTIVPCAIATSQYHDKKKVQSLSSTISSLEYWVVQILLSGLLHWWSGLLRWIPFSTHLTYLLFCHFYLTSGSWYKLLEREMQAFGLLPRSADQEITVDQTVTASVLQRLASSLPSASSMEEKDGDARNDKLTPEVDNNFATNQEESTTVATTSLTTTPIIVEKNSDQDDNFAIADADKVDVEKVHDVKIDVDKVQALKDDEVVVVVSDENIQNERPPGNLRRSTRTSKRLVQ